MSIPIVKRLIAKELKHTPPSPPPQKNSWGGFYMKIFYPKCMTETISQKEVEPNIYTYIYISLSRVCPYSLSMG